MQQWNKPTFRRIATSLAFVWMTSVLPGCAGGRIIQARRVPADLIPAPISSIQTVDLTRFARPAIPNNLLQAGDLVSVSVATGLENEKAAQFRLRVADNGACNVPLVGQVGVAGLQVSDAERAIYEESIRRGIYRNPQISLSLIKRLSHKIAVLGAVKNQGTYEIPASSSDIVRAIVAAGGFTDEADTIVEIRQPPALASGGPAGVRQASFRPDAQAMVRIDLAGQNSHRRDLRIADGATVYVRPRKLRAVYVIGLVNRVDKYEMPRDRDIRMLDAIAMAGGRTIQLADDVRIIRQIPGQSEPIMIQASVKEAKRLGGSNVLLAPGDVVSVEETPLTFAITTMRSFIRFGFSGGIPGF